MSMPRYKLVDFRCDSRTGVYVHPSQQGSFSYSDGETEELNLLALMERVSDRSSSSDELRREKGSWVNEYHCSPLRHNLLRHISFRKEASVLELGAGCGAITRQLGEYGLRVTAVEGSPLRAHIARKRCEDLSNVTVYAGNFSEIEYSDKYDYVTLIGVLEYSRQFVSAPDPIQHALEHARSLLKEDGVLIIAIENQLGLKYFCGYSEDHSGINYQGVEDRYGKDSVVTFGRLELQQRLKSAGFSATAFNYPYPDYKLPKFVLTESGVQHKGFSRGSSSSIIGEGLFQLIP